MTCDMHMREYQKISSKLLNNVIYIQISPIRHKTLQKQQEKCYYKIIEKKHLDELGIYIRRLQLCTECQYHVRVERERSCT